MPPSTLRKYKNQRAAAAVKRARNSRFARTQAARQIAGYSMPMVPRGFVGAAAEGQFFDTANAAYACNTTGSITHLDIVPQGTTINTRVGARYRLTSAHLRGYVTADTTTLVAHTAFALVWDFQPNKALPAITDIFDSISPNSFPKRENVRRFKILRYQKNTVIGNANTAGQNTAATAFPVDMYVKLPSWCVAECTTADTTGAIGNRINGALYLVTMGDVVAGTADANLAVGVRVSLKDV